MAIQNESGPVPVFAVVPAAGTGSRMNLPLNKQFLCLGRFPVIIRTLRVLEAHPLIHGYVVVAMPEEMDTMHSLIAEYRLVKCLALTAGGASRQQSVAFGLKTLAGQVAHLENCQVLVHDGARCFITPDVIDRVIAGIYEHQACGAAVAVKDTIKRANRDGRVCETLERSQLWAMQTPQGAWYPILHAAYDMAESQGWQGTDDLSLLELAGQPVYLVEGSYRNIKLTTPEDRLLGEQLARLADRAND